MKVGAYKVEHLLEGHDGVLLDRHRDQRLVAGLPERVHRDVGVRELVDVLVEELQHARLGHQAHHVTVLRFERGGHPDW
jgi:hypothetical protein